MYTYIVRERKNEGLEREVVGRKVLAIEGDRNHYGDCVGLGFEWGKRYWGECEEIPGCANSFGLLFLLY